MDQRADWAVALGQPKSLQCGLWLYYSCRHRAIQPSASRHSPEAAQQCFCLETLSRGTEGQRAQTLALLASLDLPKPSLGLPSQHQMPTQAWATMPLPSLGALPNPTCAAAYAVAKDGAAADSDQTTTALTVPLRTR